MKPLGVEFKTVACSVTTEFLFIEIQREMEETNNNKYHLQLGETGKCKNRIMEATRGIGQRDVKEATKDCFIFDSWFSSKNSLESAIDVGIDMVYMVKTNTKGFNKDTIENFTKDCLGSF